MAAVSRLARSKFTASPRPDYIINTQQKVTQMNQKKPLSKDDVLGIIRDNLADILEMDPDKIAMGNSFVDDLGADSLALIELVEAIEEELRERQFEFRIEDEDLPELRTVRDAVDYVCDRLPQA